MGRIRTIKPEFWTSEQIMECSPNARLLFIGIWNFCDDAGIHPASPKTLKAEIFPSDDISASQVARLVLKSSKSRIQVEGFYLQLRILFTSFGQDFGLSRKRKD